MWIGAAGATTGLITGVTGTFLPWLRSGKVDRDSYQVLALRHFAGLDDSLGNLVAAVWVGITPLAVLCVLLLVGPFRRIGACFALFFGTITATVAALAAVQGGDGGSLVRISLIGPAVTLCGAVLAVAGAITVLTASNRRAISTSGGTP
jgi:hypothetical protein